MENKIVYAGIFMVFVVLIVFFCFSRVYGQPPAVLSDFGGPDNDLLLSAGQSEKLDRLYGAYLKKTSKIRERLRLQEFELFTTLNREHADPSAIQQKIKSISSLEDDLEAAAQSYRGKVNDILTPAQRALLPAGCLTRFFYRGWYRTGFNSGYGRRVSNFYGRGGGMGRRFARRPVTGLYGGYGCGLARGFGNGRGYGRRPGNGFNRYRDDGRGRGRGRYFGRGW